MIKAYISTILFLSNLIEWIVFIDNKVVIILYNPEFFHF